ncbi:two-component sensor histidine kinase [Micromonospora sp. WMMA1996]|uniref:sensor histidine kinase n=1 Tax=Micromonospora sp. WMMA1996 TaxID=2039878 RepID=UPI000BF73557|nr:histidine kinase [Micromonospora sp. WMMA1996]PGH44751.1 two-component sensor histidine kinase [Micromonospora sp. WMMA1996]
MRCASSRPRFLLLLDGGIAAACLGVSLLVLLTSDAGPATTGGTAVAVGLAALQASCLLWIRRRPGYALAVAALAGVGLEAFCPQLGWLGLVAAPLSYVARLRRPRFSLVALGLLVAPTPWKLVTGDWRDMLLAATGLGLGWSVGELLRAQEQRRCAWERQVRAVERERISRELHDVVAHHVAVIAVQAVAAEDVFDQQPEQARAALGSIHVAARSALTELRAMLHALTADGGSDPDAPQPGLAQLDALVDAVRAVGLPVTLRREGDGEALPGGVQLSAYRIVQESLTNALRHGHATRADVDVRYDGGVLRLEVVNDGAAPARRSGTSEGRGIVGMRERARLLGGTLDAGPLPSGGFRVRAQLPVGAAR